MDHNFQKEPDGRMNSEHIERTDMAVIGTTDDQQVIYRRADESGQEMPVAVVCINHIDVGIDDFVNELEQPPDLYKLDSVTFSDWQPPISCKYCSDKPVLLIV